MLQNILSMKNLITQNKIPRWRGFNIQHMFSKSYNSPLHEDDYKFIHDHGFDFVRVPLNYHFWVNDNPRDINFEVLNKIDNIIDMGIKYNIHIDLNFHRGPGYSVNQEYKEVYSLWKDTQALEDFSYHWQIFAERYKNISSDQLSFNLINEPAGSADEFDAKDYEKVVRTTVKAIKEIDKDRLIIIDGTNYGNIPCPELADLEIVQSCRGYLPIELTHYKAHWVTLKENISAPEWPGIFNDCDSWNYAVLESHYKKWVELAKAGIGVHCGEFGVYNHTSHNVALAWMEDLLKILYSHNIGYALWGLHGAFGIIDSNRPDVIYEKYLGYNIDRKMLDLLIKY